MKRNRLKKFIVLIAAIVMALSAFTSYASDAADLYLENLMTDEKEHIFFGEVQSYNPDSETRDIEITPVKNIKGNVAEGQTMSFQRPRAMGDFEIVVGNTYLISYYETLDSVDMFDVTTYNTKTLKIKHVDEELWKIFETYLNEGKFGEAKIGGGAPFGIIIAGVVVVAGVIAAVVVMKRKK